jgi:hypothetical protein
LVQRTPVWYTPAFQNPLWSSQQSGCFMEKIATVP